MLGGWLTVKEGHDVGRTKPQFNIRTIRICSAGVVILLAGPAVLRAQAVQRADPPPIVVAAGQSSVLDAPWPVQRLSITNPQVADVEAISPTQVLLLGRKVGTTDLVLWSAGGEVWQRRIDVHIDPARLRKELTDLFPGSDLDVTQSQDVVIITGALPTRVHGERLRTFLEAAEKATGLKYVDMVSVAGVRSTSEPRPGSIYTDAERLKQDLLWMFPDSTLDVRQSGDVMVISGTLRRTEQAQQLRKYLEALQELVEQRRTRRGPSHTRPAGTFEEETSEPEPVPAADFRFIDMTSVAGVQQVQLKVRIAEVSRTALRNLGVNILQTGHHDNTFFGASTIGPSVGGALVPMTIGPPRGAIAGNEGVPFTFNADVNVPPSVSLFFGFPRAELEFFLEALAENTYLRLLSEPTLVALSGEEASFLAGGEFPIPVVQSGVGGGALSITIEYKEFGVRLRFRPTVLGDGTIRLHLAPEVSDLSNVGAVIIQGFQVPSLVTRRAETTLELKSGQSFAMAGLLSNRNEARNSRTPGLGDVPVLGSLFRSVRYVKGETDLVVLVTASLVEPLSLAEAPPLPGVCDTVPNDWEFYGLGMIEGGSAPTLSPAEAAWLESLNLDELKGPGAWERYEQGMARSQAEPIRPPARAAEAEPAPAAAPIEEAGGAAGPGAMKH